MENHSCPPRPELPLRAADMGLAVKDGVREVRFNLRRGAQKLVQGAQAGVHAEERRSASGPLALFGEPVELAMRTTARLLRQVDRAAVDLLSSDGAYRALEVPLRSSISYFGRGLEAGSLRLFTQDHYWRYRHWLEMKGRTDVFVREQGIERAGLQIGVDPPTAGECRPDGDRFLRLAQAIVALAASDILVRSADADQRAATVELPWQAAVSTVLAGEIALVLPELPPKEQTLTALQLADEIRDATQQDWAHDLAADAPVASLARWLDFALRHV